MFGVGNILVCITGKLGLGSEVQRCMYLVMLNFFVAGYVMENWFLNLFTG